MSVHLLCLDVIQTPNIKSDPQALGKIRDAQVKHHAETLQADRARWYKRKKLRREADARFERVLIQIQENKKE